MPRKLKNLQQIHADNVSAKEPIGANAINKSSEKLPNTTNVVADDKPKRKKYSSLDQVWGDTGLSRYNTLDLPTYQKYLKELNKADLETHARTLGFLPSAHPELLIQRLEREFQRYVSSFNVPVEKDKPNAKVPAHIAKILAEGR